MKSVVSAIVLICLLVPAVAFSRDMVSAPRQSLYSQYTATCAGVRVYGVLDSNTEVGGPFDPADPYNTSDSILRARNSNCAYVIFLRMKEQSTAGNTWEWHALPRIKPVRNSTMISGEIVFDPEGRLWSESSTATSLTPVPPDCGDAVSTEGGTGLKGVTQWAGPFSEPPHPTSEMLVYLNLPASSVANPGGAWDYDHPSDTSNVCVQHLVYDRLGNVHPVIVCFRLESVGAFGNDWSYHVIVPAEHWWSPTPGAQYMEGAAGTLSFDVDGRLMEEFTIASSFDFAGWSAPGQTIVFDFGDSVVTNGGTGVAGSTQLDESFSIKLIDQDGYVVP